MLPVVPHIPGLDLPAIARLFEPGTFARGLDYARQGRVGELQWEPGDQMLFASVRGSGRSIYRVFVAVPRDARGKQWIDSGCTCPVGVSCKHAVAVLCQAAGAGDANAGGLRGNPPAGAAAPGAPLWQRELDDVLAAAAPATVHAEPVALALQFRVDGLVKGAARGSAAAGVPLDVSVRPVRESDGGGGWTAGWDVGWDALRSEHRASRFEPVAREWLAELGALRSQGYWGSSSWTPLGEFSGRLLWQHLARGKGLGVPFVGSARRDVVALADGLSLEIDVTGHDGAARLSPRVLVQDAGETVVAQAALRGTLGAYGLFTVTEPAAGTKASGRRAGGATAAAAGSGAAAAGAVATGWTITLGPTPGPLTPAAVALLDAGVQVEVPSSDVDRLRTEYLPVLGRHVPVTSSDASVEIPPPLRPALRLTATFAGPTAAHLTSEWVYAAPGDAGSAPPPPAGVVYPFRATPADASRRDLAERELAERAAAAGRAAGFANFVVTDRLAAEGFAALDLAERLLPALARVDGVDVVTIGEPTYTELTTTPQIDVATRDTEDRDWFDLAVTIRVGEREIPLPIVLEGLAAGKKRVMLADGAWLKLGHPSLERLRDLLAEADALTDRRSKDLRVNRLQATLVDELAELADVVAMSQEWQRSAGGLLALTQGDGGTAVVESVPVPQSVHAVLRPYQREGFEWLAFCWAHRLGGILADDMGLGKTLQVLALLAHARTQDPGAPPFLVVAPASVVGNWVAEAARFTPHLVVTPTTTTTAKRKGVPLDEVTRGADVVVTSYAVFRLDADAFSAHPWSGLILDEAQFVKNHATRGHRAARSLRAPFKLAITGTPLENDVTDLWSLLAVVAPGLFPSFQAFREDYLKPIEAASRADADDAMRAAARERISRLQRRARPLLLRRTKDQVAPELPPRQEQVITVELAPGHRRAYETHLARERKRVLGLLDDFEANRVAVFRALTTLRRMALDASLVDPQAYAGVPSSKLDVLFEQLGPVVAEGHRALVFSQFTGYLELIEARCRQAGIPYAYLDGSTPTRRRGDLIAAFKAGDAPLFLISLKAGGFGLNLTEADYVYLLDPWWNPATEAQAVDRTHRIGQTRPVNVVRLVSARTVEEKVMALKERKARLVDAVLGDDAELFARTIGADELRGLFE